MKKINTSHILAEGASLSVTRLFITEESVSKLIKETKEKQERILKLKEIDQISLKRLFNYKYT
jgi:hypothetical protein